MGKFLKERIFVVFALITQIIAEPCVPQPPVRSVTGSKYTKVSCNAAANLLLSGMSATTNPCDNFYIHACGNWLKENLFDPSYEINDHSEAMKLKTQMIFEEMLQSPITLSDIDAVRKAKLSHQTCMNEDKIDDDGLKGIKEILRSNGGWPLMMLPPKPWIEGANPWQDIYNNYMNKVGGLGLFTIDVAADSVDIDRHRIWIRPPTEFRLPAIELVNFGIDNALMASYINYTWQIVKSMGHINDFDGSKYHSLENMYKMANFEIQLATITLPQKPADSVSYLMTIDKLQELYDSAKPLKSTSRINWLYTIRKSILADLPNIKITGKEKIRVVGKQFWPKLAKLLEKTPEKIVVNYVHWKLVDKTIVYSTTRMRENLHNLLLESELDSLYEPRNVWCQKVADLPHAIDYAYVQEHMSDTAIAWAQKVFKRMKKMIVEQNKGSPLLDKGTKRLIKKNLGNMNVRVGYPGWYTEKKINNYYYDLEVGDNFLNNTINRWHFDLNKKRRLLRTPTKKKWHIRATDIATYFDRKTNTLMIPLGMLQSPYFDAERLAVINYGWAGVLIGLGIVQGLSQLDKQGNDTLRFGKKFKTTQIITKSGTNNQDDTNRMFCPSNGEGMWDKHIMGALGVSLARAVYIEYDSQSDLTFSDFNVKTLSKFTQDKIFFLSVAKIFCPIESSDEDRMLGKSQLIDILSAMQSFSKAYDCSLGFPMNPREKCVIYGLYEN